jgi:PAS domain S-box-containing protein
MTSRSSDRATGWFPTAGLLSPGLPVRQVIADSWERSRSAGVDPRHAPLHRVDAGELADRLEANADLIAAARPHLDWISTLLDGVPHVVYLADADGVVLLSEGNDASLRREAGLEPGYDWSEARMGTNGAGTALATGRPEVVRAEEHYVEAFHGCTCTAAPIAGPGGRPLGALDITTGVAAGGPERLLLVMHAARVIERDLEAIRKEAAVGVLRQLAAELLAGDDDSTRALERVPELLVPAVADWAVLFLRDGSGCLKALAGHRDPAQLRRLRRLWTDAEVEAWSGHPVAEVLRTGEPVLLPQVAASDLEAIAMPAGRRRLLRALGPRSWLCVPVGSGPRAGALLLASASPARTFGGRDLAVAIDLAALLALYVDNRVLRAGQQARAREAERARCTLEALLEHVPEGITIAAAPDVTIEHVSRHGQELTGRPGAELKIAAGHDLHATTWRIRHPDGRPARDDELPLTRAVRDGVVSTDEEWILEAADGERITILTNAGPIRDGGGNVTGGVIAWRDISERKQAEEALRAREAELRGLYEKTEQAVRARDHLVAVVSHDLRNPLSVVTMAAGNLLEPGLPEERKAVQVGLIRRAAAQMQRLIDDLLDVNRIEAGRMRLERRRVFPRDVIDQARLQVAPLADARGLHIRVRVNPDTGAMHADASRLLQVLDNLLGNAIRYAPARTPITVAAARRGTVVEFSVADAGPGIPPAERDHLFHPFRQGPGPRGGSAGLGLSICRTFVEAHGGRIWLDEQADVGTTIRFTIPVAAGSDEG